MMRGDNNPPYFTSLLTHGHLYTAVVVELRRGERGVKEGEEGKRREGKKKQERNKNPPFHPILTRGHLYPVVVVGEEFL